MHLPVMGLVQRTSGLTLHKFLRKSARGIHGDVVLDQYVCMSLAAL